jgi:hypothetical protein
MNYEEMSDLQINLLVANAIGVDAAENSGVVFGAVKHEGDNVVSVMGVVDYCNNPSDAWPIIVANRINVYASEGPDFMPWMAGCGGFMVSNKNPLRAAMVVFLMMQEQYK